MTMPVTIPKRLTHGTELVVVSRKEYERLLRHLAETQDALGKIRRGEQEYRAGKTRVIRSLADLRR
ncbi:MAG: hypothetical protein HYZ92_01355 [Candidatus Omnitrophica bacterium]|nr:hypothetical protein [Candidatus Omnitrophota bacterium]